MTQAAFAFGRNWQSFLAHALNAERLDEAKKSLVAFCGAGAIQGKTFLDIGCGSGLFSLAAHALGAKRILSFDVDPQSVACTRLLWERAGKPVAWEVRDGSILDPSLLSSLGAFDLVYSWGVLHHTGRMWDAIQNAASLVAPGGLLYIAIYNKAEGWRLYPDGRLGPSTFWVKEKRIYARLPWIVQNVIDYALIGLYVVMQTLMLRNPFRRMREHVKLRGMSFRIDLKDWLGGYPYEYASVEEVTRFLADRGFVRENLLAPGGLLNNEFLFRKS